MSDIETHYYGDGHDHGQPDETEIPDAFTMDSICGAWQLAPHVIGTKGHRHICRDTPHHWEEPDGPADLLHHCICGHTW